MKEQECADIAFLALALWREARGESPSARLGVAHAIMNRVLRPGWWGNDVTSVLFKKWQFSSLTDPNDRQLTTWPGSSDKVWQECLAMASDVLSGNTENPVPGADSYYDISIKPPKWATPGMFVAQIGRIRFFDVDNDFERSTTGAN